MYQAITKVNVSSPEMTNIVEVDAFHSDRRQYHCNDKGKEAVALPGSEAMAWYKMADMRTWEIH